MSIGEEIGKTYYYVTKGGTINQSKLVSKTPAWLIFENGDHMSIYTPLCDTEEEIKFVVGLVNAMYRKTYVPDVVHIPNAFIKP